MMRLIPIGIRGDHAEWKCWSCVSSHEVRLVYKATRKIGQVIVFAWDVTPSLPSLMLPHRFHFNDLMTVQKHMISKYNPSVRITICRLSDVKLNSKRKFALCRSNCSALKKITGSSRLCQWSIQRLVDIREFDCCVLAERPTSINFAAAIAVFDTSWSPLCKQAKVFT